MKLGRYLDMDDIISPSKFGDLVRILSAIPNFTDQLFGALNNL